MHKNVVKKTHLKRQFIRVLSRVFFDCISSTHGWQVDGRIVFGHQQAIATIIHLQFKVITIVVTTTIIVISIIAKRLILLTDFLNKLSEYIPQMCLPFVH